MAKKIKCEFEDCGYSKAAWKITMKNGEVAHACNSCYKAPWFWGEMQGEFRDEGDAQSVERLK